MTMRKMVNGVRGISALLLLGLAVPRAAAAPGAGFIRNDDQLNANVKYYLPGGAAAVYFTRDAVVVDMKERVTASLQPPAAIRAPAPETQVARGCAVYVRFEGANANPTIEARGALATRYNYFLGKNPSDWRTDVPAFSEVVYHDLWPGVDLVYRQDGGDLTYEVVASPGSDLSAVQFEYDGADQVKPEEDGSRLVRTSVGSFTDSRSLSDRGHGRLLLRGASATSPGQPPMAAGNPAALLWSTYLGGSTTDDCLSLALDASGNAVVTGQTASADFPTTPGAYDRTLSSPPGYDVFVSKISADGSSLLWSTYIVGNMSTDVGRAVAVDSLGNVVVAGYTDSPDFPTTPGAYDRSYNGGMDAFVSKLSPTGSALLWSTFLGGPYTDWALALMLDPLGNPVVAGYTSICGFPTTPGAYDRTCNGGDDAFVAKLSSDGSSLLWSTLLGGTGGDYGHGLAFDAAGNVVVMGSAGPGFPTTPGAYCQSFSGGYSDAYVAKLSPNGSSLLWSTYIGGIYDDYGYGLALDAAGNAVVTGWTFSADFPTTPGAYDRSYHGGSDVYVSKVSSDGSTLLWSTYLAGIYNESGNDVALDRSGNPIVIGATASPDFPTTPGAFDRTYHGGYEDAFATELSSNGSSLIWSTYLGGNSGDVLEFAVVDPSGNVVVAGSTASTDFPTTPGAYDQTANGYDDVMVMKLEGQSGTAVAGGAPAPVATGLLPAIPNPFSQATEIRYSLKQEADVELDVLDVTGRRVIMLASGPTTSGEHRVSWDGRDDHGGRVGSGIYFVRCAAGGSTHYGRIVRLQ